MSIEKTFRGNVYFDAWGFEEKTDDPRNHTNQHERALVSFRVISWIVFSLHVLTLSRVQNLILVKPYREVDYAHYGGILGREEKDLDDYPLTTTGITRSDLINTVALAR